MKKNNKFKSIIKIIIVLLIIYFVFSTVSKLFNKTKEIAENVVNNFSNSYVENHNVSYDMDTDIDNTNSQTTEGTRAKYTTILGDGKDEVTVMVYMIGTDLESSYGMATKDINEMLYGKTSDNINLIVETGGCKSWNNTLFADGEVERWTVNSENFLRLKNPGKVAMTDPDELSDFISYAADNFPANRYILILWDHGGGSEAGFGYDENYPNQDSMTPSDIGAALKKAGIKFDIIGFDACLMANLETAIAIEPYADYLIGSEETEPGEGWYYTNWIKMLDENTSTPSLTLAKQIVDDYVSTSLAASSSDEITQSVIDLGELVSNIKEPLIKFSSSTLTKLNGSEYQSLATARSNTKEFSKSSKLDQVDLIDLANKFAVDGSDELVSAIKSAIKYNKTCNINNSYGLSVYFPYSALTKVNSMIEIYDDIQMAEEYTGMVKSFATYLSSGQIVTQNYQSSNTSLFDVLLDNNHQNNSHYDEDSYDSLFSDAYNNDYNGHGYEDSFGEGYTDWMDNSSFDAISTFFRNHQTVNPAKLQFVTKNGQNVVSLSEDEWAQISDITLNVFIDDGEGYLDLGKDNVFEWNETGDLIVDYDGTWLAINDTNVVAYHFLSEVYVDENNYKITGYIPAYLNDQRVNLMVNFTAADPYGVILGGQLLYEDNDMVAKGLIELKDGDELRFICDYYRYDGTMIAEYQIGESLMVKDSLELANVNLANDYVFAYCLQDIYGNVMWTPITDAN